MADGKSPVAGMFGRIARWYDFLNHFLSLGIDRRWRRRLVAGLSLPADGTVLDLAAGTLDVSIEIKRVWPGVRIVAADFSPPMLHVGQGKIAGKGLSIWPVCADGKKLPLPDACVDAVTIAFGIRNIRPRDKAYAEILRVLKPGGTLNILEFGTGEKRIWRGLYNFYLNHLLPMIGKVVSGDSTAYRYLADTIREFPPERELAGEMRAAGFERVDFYPLTSGIVYVHVGRKSAGAGKK